MLASIYPGSAGSLLRSAVSSIESIVQRLEFADTAGGDHWPLCCRLRGLDCLRDDLKAAAAGDGVTGAEVYRLVVQAHDQLLQVVEAHDAGDLEPWRTRREDVLVILATLRQLCEPPDAELVTRSAAVPAAAPRLTPARPLPVVVHADVEPGRKGEKAEKGPAGPRGRPPKDPDATRIAEAAWWRDHVHLEPAVADQSEDDTLDQLFERMTDDEFEIRLHQLGAEDLPAWWPTGPGGRRVDVVRFRDRWDGISSTTWAKYVQRFDNDHSRHVAPRHHQGNVEPPAPKATKKPARATSAAAAIRAFDDAAEIASSLFVTSDRDRGKLREDLLETLSRVGIVGLDADEIMDLEPAEMVAEFEKRRRLVEDSQAGTKSRR